MQLEKNTIENVLTLAINGRIDSVTSVSFEEELLSAIDKGHSNILLDFAKLDFISSSGLRVLLLVAKKLKQASGQLVITEMTQDIRDIFDLTGFSSIFYIYSDAELALKHFK